MGMATQGVLISCSPTPGNKEGSVCSGILFSDYWILTIGTLLDSVFQGASNKHEHAKKQAGPEQIVIVPTSLQNKLPKFTIVMNNNNFVPKLTVPANVSAEEGATTCKGVVQSSELFQKRERRAGRLAALWRCPLVTESTNQLLRGWQLTPTDPKEDEDTTSKALLSTFLLLCLDGEVPMKLDSQDVLAALGLLSAQVKRPRRGEDVIIESTIFGREFFFNSWSQGIVSNIFGSYGSLLLTDARSATGCEGGPIFTLSDRSRERRLLGMVLSPVCWWKGEWVGFTVGVALQPMITRLHSRSPRVLLPSRLSGSAEGGRGLDSSVVLVRCGSSWGSGVVIDSALGLILTCAHVVRGSERSVSVWWADASHPATVVYHTRTDVAYDLALIRVTPHTHMQQVVLAQSPAVKGEPVFVVGFPIFSERDHRHLVPVVSRGIVSHVTGAMVQTTCCVQSGVSGGPVLREGGEMVAVVCCNANNLDTGALFPHVNMAVPTCVFARHVQRYIDTLDVEALRPLEEPDQQVQRMWKLQFTTSKL